MTLKTLALVLRTLKYGDDKLIVDMYGRDCGRVSFIMPVPRGGRSKMRRQYFQPLTQLLIEFDNRPGRALQRLREASPAHVYATLHTDASKVAQAIFLADFLSQALRSEPQGGPIFDFVADSLQWLDGCAQPCPNFHVVFLMRLTLFLGLLPNTEDYHAGEYFDLRAGAFCQLPPPHTDCLAPEEAATMRTLMRMNYATMHLFRLNRDQRNQLIDTILRYYHIHLPDFQELKSLDVLRELSR